ncbi:uncharacterized protein LOC114815071 isoform X1 [Ornithorhynchus anatinus]|uniref:uncharacterized protein LOC114815071 isoform X1 n=1 Tax=Ornithorhynchus anatinus TaxID=9258 RepID=UPI0010A87BB6|nr:uncharacterized protein LOC114815071 isoform X1 [Ornithorhynchus anatinus]
MRPGPWVPPCPSQPCSSSVLGWLPNPPPVFRRPPPSGILSCVCHSTAADTDTHLSPATRSGPAQPPVTRIPTHPLSVNPQPQVQHPPLQAQGGSVDSEGLRGIWGESWKISRSPNPAPSSQGLLSASFCNLRGPVPQQSSQSRSCLLPEAGSGFRTRLLEVVMGLEGSQMPLCQPTRPAQLGCRKPALSPRREQSPVDLCTGAAAPVQLGGGDQHHPSWQS